jgi:hypothetical protein
MNHWTRRLLALAAPLLLTGCLWGPGKFASDLTLRKNGTFTLDYKGEIVLQLPPDESKAVPWDPAEMIRCHQSGKIENWPDVGLSNDDDDPVRPCTAPEIAKGKADYEAKAAQTASSKRKENEEMAKAFGLPGLDDESNRAFAAKLMKYEGWRSVTYRGKGVYDVDYHLEGRLTQDFVFPTLPDNDFIIPFIAIRRRTDGSVLVTAPAMTGPAARMGPGASSMMSSQKDGPRSFAQGRLTVITDGEILTNNSEDGATPNPLGRAVRWDVSPASTKIPETLVRLR